MGWTWRSSLWERPYRTGEGSPDDHASLTPTFLRLALREVTPGTRILDLGCGAGRAGLAPEAAFRETERLRFADWGEAHAYLRAAGLWERWAAEGRGESLRAAFTAGTRTLTVRSTLLFKLRR